MPKIKALITIKNEEENTTYEVAAILHEDIIKYIENNETTVLYDYDNNNLTRDNEELRMDYSFDISKETEGKINIKELGKTLNIKIKTKKLERKNNNIEIVFSIDDKEFLYKIEEIK